MNQNHESFKIKGYPGITFLYSNWIYAFLLVVQMVGLGFFAQGLTIFFWYDTLKDIRLILLWFGIIFSTVCCVCICMANFSNKSTFMKFSILLVGISLILTFLEIALLVNTRNKSINQLSFCGASVKDSTCLQFWGQPFCGNYIVLKCTQVSSGFKKLMLSLIAITLVQTFLIGLSLLKLFKNKNNTNTNINNNNNNNNNNNKNFNYQPIINY